MAPDVPRLMRIATVASMTVAVVLIGAKTAAWLLTESVSMLSSLVDSSLDFIASLVTFLAVRQALTPADADHRFGHGKAEALAGLAQAGFIAGNRLTRHAMERMLERGLTAADVEDAIVNPVSTQPGNKPNTTKFFGVNADVVVD